MENLVKWFLVIMGVGLGLIGIFRPLWARQDWQWKPKSGEVTEAEKQRRKGFGFTLLAGAAFIVAPDIMGGGTLYFALAIMLLSLVQ
jgi:hypothetical protein